MSQFTIKIPNKLKRVEIIHDPDAELEGSDIFPPFDKHDKRYGRKGPFKPDIYADKEALKDRLFIFEESSVKFTEEPIQISLHNISEKSMSITEVQKEVQHAYDRGFDDAQQLTRTTFEIELQKRQHWILNFDSVLKDLRTQFSQELQNMEDALIPVAIMVAEQILGEEAKTYPELIINQVKRAIKAIDNDTIFKIHLHPYNIEILENVKSSLSSDSSKIENVLLTPNESIDQGSCLLETSAGTVDATFKAQLEKIRKSLIHATDNFDETDNVYPNPEPDNLEEYDINENDTKNYYLDEDEPTDQ